MVSCPNCSTGNPDGARFCLQCGSRLELSCPQCGTELPPTARFCFNCGHKLGEERPPARGEPIEPGQGGDRIQDSIQRLIPREFARKLEAARLDRAMEGERRVVTILFCDIQGSTAAAERLDPEEWTEIVNGAFEHMIAPVYKYEGTVARLMGDAILAFFGAPIAHEDDPQRAVLAGLEILDGIRSYREQVERSHRLDINVRAGINTGLVVVGAVGSDLRMEYTAMGDAINVAARMEQTSVPGSVQIAEETCRLVAPLFELEELGPIQVKGKNDPVRAYRVLGPKQEPGRVRGIAGLDAPLIGRERERGQLANRLADLTKGVGGIILLVGEAGLGKSRLIGELKTEAVRTGLPVNWYETGGVAYESEQPYRIFQRLLRSGLGVGPNEPQEVLAAKVDALADSAPPEEQDLWRQVLAPFFGLPLQRMEQPLRGEVYKGRLFSVMASVWSRWAAARPLVVVCDDLHWADPASVELLVHLLPLVERVPLLLICAMRADRESPGWRLNRVAEDEYPHRITQIGLRPLTDEESADLVDSLIDSPRLPTPLRSAVLEKAEGNPFFIEEVVRALIDDARTGLAESEPRVGTDMEIPGSLQALILARIDRLEEDARRTLQLAAVIGRSFYYRVLECVADFIQEVDSQVLTLQRADLIRESARIPELEYLFKHTLTQEVAYSTILLKQRQDYHRRVGEAIEGLFSDQRETLYPVLAYHFSRARDRRAADYAYLAGENAFRLFAIPEALASFSRSLDMMKAEPDPSNSGWIERCTQLYLRRGRCLELQSDYHAAQENYREMEAHALSLGVERMVLAALVARATAYAIPSPAQDARKGEDLAQKALALARSLDDQAAEAKITWVQLLIYMYSGRMPESIPYGERAVEMARRLGHPEQLALSLQDLARPYLGVGRLKEARTLLEESGGLWRELGNLPLLVEVFSSMVLVSVMEGKFDEGMDYHRQASKISQAINNEWGQVSCRSFIGLGLSAMGEVDSCLQLISETMLTGEKVGHPGRFGAWYLKGRLYLNLGARREAFEMAEQGVHKSMVFPPFHPLSLAFLAELMLESGELEVAGDLLAQAEALGTRQTLPLIDFTLDLTEAELALARGLAGEALSKADSLLAKAEVCGVRAFLPDIWRLRWRVLGALGEADDALESLQAACTSAEAIGHRLRLWELRAELAAEFEKRGDRRAAREARRSAGITAAAIAGKISDASLRRTFLAHAASKGVPVEEPAEN